MGNMGTSRRRLAIALGILGVLAVAVALWLRRGDSGDGAAGQGASAGGTSGTAGASGSSGARGGDGAAGAAVRSPDERGGPLRLDGQLLDEAGAPVPDALVAISTEPPRTTRSQADGSFSFDKLIPRHFTLYAQDGDLVGTIRHRLTSTSDPAIVRMRRGTRVLVQVRDEAGQPIAGAEVGAPVTYLEEVGEKVLTDADGKATLRGLGNLPWGAIRATAPGYAPGGATALPDVSERSETSVQITLRRGVVVSGTVRDEHGKPIAGAKVYCSSTAYFRPGEQSDVTSDAQGAFRFSAISPGDYQVSAADPSYSGSNEEKIAVGGEAITGLALTMAASATIAGAVVLPDGSPVPYAILRASSKEDPSAVPRWVASDGKGRFELAGLPRKLVQVVASDERASSAIIEVSLAEAPRKDDVRLVLDVTGTLSGVVVDERGEPVPEIQVKAQLKQWMTSYVESYLKGSPVAMTDGSGAFSFHGLPDDDYMLTLRDEPPDIRSSPTTYRPGAPGIKLVLQRMGAITGRLVDGKGEPLSASAYVILDQRGPAITSTGSFRLEELRPGTYGLQLRAAGYALKRIEKLKVVAGETLALGDIKLESGRRIRGRVVDGEGKAVAGARIKASRYPSFPPDAGERDEESVMDLQMGTRVATSDGRGAFELAGIPDEEQFLAAYADGASSSSAQVAAGAGDPPPVTLVLNRFGSVEGVVTKQGKPVSGAVILIMPRKRDGGGFALSTEVTTGTDGRFLAPKVSPGEMEVQVMRGNLLGNQKSTPVTVEAGKRARVAVEITGGDATLTVEVKAQKGQRVDSAEVALFDGAVEIANGEVMLDRATKDGAGRFMHWSSFAPTAFADLQPGAYTLCGVPFTGDHMDRDLMQRAFHHRAKRPAICKPMTVTAAAEQKVTLELPSMPELPPVPPDKLRPPPGPPSSD